MMKNDVYFIVIAFLVAELFKILFMQIREHVTAQGHFVWSKRSVRPIALAFLGEPHPPIRPREPHVGQLRLFLYNYFQAVSPEA